MARGRSGARLAGPCRADRAGDRRGPGPFGDRQGGHRGRCRRRPAGVGRFALGRSVGRQRDRRGPPLSPYRLRPHRRSSLRLPAGPRRADDLPLRRARRQRRAHVAVPSPFATRSRAARWNDRRCRRRSLRQSGGAPRPRVSGWARDGAGGGRWESRGPPLPAPAVDRSGAARRQFQRAEDRPPLPGQTPGRPRRHASSHGDRPRRPRGVFPAGRRRDDPRQGRSGPRPDRLPRPRGRGWSDGKQELARSPRAPR